MGSSVSMSAYHSYDSMSHRSDRQTIYLDRQLQPTRKIYFNNYLKFRSGASLITRNFYFPFPFQSCLMRLIIVVGKSFVLFAAVIITKINNLTHIQAIKTYNVHKFFSFLL